LASLFLGRPGARIRLPSRTGRRTVAARMDFTAQLQAYRQRAERAVQEDRPRQGPPRLNAATDYSLAAGGKRLRPILVLAAADLFGAPEHAAAAAAAVEYIHTYSLIHDDLPCMDNDDLRRGRPTVHRQFDEATALLAGDALLTEAFLRLAQAYGDRPAVATRLTLELGRAASGFRLIGGQVEDMLAEKNPHVTAEQLRSIHLKKTAAMIAVSLVMGGIVGGAAPEQVETLRDAGEQLGLAFQIVDDILDATADTATLGKTAGKDARADKTTYVKLHGLEASRKFARQHTDTALALLAKLPGDKGFLSALIESMAGRVN
jgi:geranylgeranyl diphosphate synthase type II